MKELGEIVEWTLNFTATGTISSGSFVERLPAELEYVGREPVNVPEKIKIDLASQSPQEARWNFYMKGNTGALHEGETFSIKVITKLKELPETSAEGAKLSNKVCASTNCSLGENCATASVLLKNPKGTVTAKKVTTRTTPVTKIGDEIDWVISFTAAGGKATNITDFYDIIPEYLTWDGELRSVTWSPSTPEGNLSVSQEAVTSPIKGNKLNFIISALESGQTVSVTLRTTVKSFPEGQDPKIINCVEKTAKKL